ncbi:hypothetical protein [Paenibacillus sp. FSL H8-0259]|uniref:hypothetical protein n=1 Tax=Paenibacillus sp. FSL H8-0259 TaxID=1920423 RepID=UPI00096E38C5|nr:hypothetical protein [Paenibacillus sp. FSL H8-0259]OMF28170.1 hypothetical protein BK132_13925 [Paenibacillus sp. FSL H8-0259]
MFRALNIRHTPFLTWQSIRVKMMVGLFLIVIPLIAFLIYSNVYAIHTVRTQVADNYLNGLMLEPELSDFNFYTEPDERLFVKQRIDVI